MATTFDQLLVEFYDRGFQYLNDGGVGAVRAKAWVNQSYVALCARADFPWLYKDITGTAPLTISDMREVLSVTDTSASTLGRQLWREDRRSLLDWFGSLSTTGTPVYWYRDSGTAIDVYPANTVDVLSVRYLKKPAVLVSGGDAVVVPDEWADLIVDGAVLRGKKDDDLYDQYVNQYEADVARMVEAEMDDGAAAEFVLDTGASQDWGGYHP